MITNFVSHTIPSMKSLFLICCILVCFTPQLHAANPPQWEWAYAQDSTFATSSATDKDGNIYVCGSFLGTRIWQHIAVTEQGKGDAFVAKFNAAGTIQWVKALGGKYGEVADAIAVHASGDIYIRGSFSDTLFIDGNTYGSRGMSDVFVTKLDAAGNVVWTKTGGSPANDFVFFQGMSLDKDGNVLITGRMMKPAIFDNDTVNAAIYIVKYDKNGNVKWATGPQSIPGTLMDIADIATDTTGNVYITGNYRGALVFNTDTIKSSNNMDSYVARYRPDGVVDWAISSSSILGSYGISLICDQSNNLYLSGVTNDDNIQLAGLISNAINRATYICKIDSTGNGKWIQRLGGSSTNPQAYMIPDMAIDAKGDLYVIGSYEDTVYLSPGISYGQKNISNMFVAKYATDGTPQWINGSIGPSSTDPRGICVDNNGYIYTTGTFFGNQKSIDFGAHNITSNSSSNNLFVAKLSYTTGIETTTLSGNNNIKIYPNPTSNNITIEDIQPATTIQLFDVTGRLVATTTAQHSTTTISTYTLAAGTYILHFTLPNGKKLNSKITKQ